MLLVAGLGVTALAGCEEPPATSLARDVLTEMNADQVMFGMEGYLTQEGVRSRTIRADTAFFYNDSSVVHLWGVDMTLYREDGERRAAVTAERGEFDQGNGRMVARGNVVVRMEDPSGRIESAELHLDPESERIWSDSATVYVQQADTTRGTCFSSDLQFREYTVCDIRGSTTVAPGATGGEGRPPSGGGGTP